MTLQMPSRIRAVAWGFVALVCSGGAPPRAAALEQLAAPLDAALIRTQEAIATATSDPERARAVLAQADVLESLGQRVEAEGARMMAYAFDTEAPGATALMEGCSSQWEAFETGVSGTVDEVRAVWGPLRSCVVARLRTFNTYASNGSLVRDNALLARGWLIVDGASGLIRAVGQALARSDTSFGGALAGLLAGQVFEVDEQQSSWLFLAAPQDMVDDAKLLLLGAAGMHRQYTRRAMSVLSDADRREFMARAPALESQQLVALTFAHRGQRADIGFLAALLGKQLLADASRGEAATLRRAVETSGDEWRALWAAHTATRETFATLALRRLRAATDEAGSVALAADAELNQLARELDRQEAELRSTNEIYAVDAGASDQIDLSHVTNALRPNDVLIEYARYRRYSFSSKAFVAAERLGAFVVTATGDVRAVDLGPLADVEAAVAAFRGEIDAWRLDPRGGALNPPGTGAVRRSEDAIAQASSDVHRLVWSPLSEALAGKRRVYVAPDGPLHLMPFEALATRRDSAGDWRYLGEDQGFEIAYVTSGRDLANWSHEKPAAPQAPMQAVFVVSPHFSSALPWISETQGLLENRNWSVARFDGAEATERAVSGVEVPQLLQFVAHGCVLDRPGNETSGWDNPMLRSMLVLAGAELAADGCARPAQDTSAGDGILTAYEVTRLNLQGTALVNLTACETSIGDLRSDGAAGLRQAFLLAGAKAVTASMWTVPTPETLAQTEQFYDAWLRDSSTSGAYTAFRTAQLEAIETARRDYGSAHPYYWAGMVYVGDPGDAPVAQ